jgi:hypothetical protein
VKISGASSQMVEKALKEAENVQDPEKKSVVFLRGLPYTSTIVGIIIY